MPGRMYVREDDTLVCRDCYDDEGGDHVARPAHREIHARVDQGECASCGEYTHPRGEASALRILDAVVVLRCVSPNDMQRAFDRQADLFPNGPSGGLDGSLNDDLREAAGLLRACVSKLTSMGVDIDKLDV